MTDQPMIIQFIHTGREYRVRNANEPVTWVHGSCDGACKGGSSASHTRRLVSHKGRYVDVKGNMKTAKLAFWTEWEACSCADEMPLPPNNREIAAHWIHTPISPLGGKGRNRLNTDPCVFGSTFKYCCCHQSRTGILKRLAPGSIILFGSNMQGRFFLDTVFVVGNDYIPYKTGKTQKFPVSKEYAELALNRLGAGDDFTFYRGMTADPISSSGLYSFSPARPFKDGDYRCGERFALDIGKVNNHLTSNSRNLSSSLKQNFKRIDVTADTAIRAVWKEILRQVYAANFVPAVHFDWPRQ